MEEFMKETSCFVEVAKGYIWPSGDIGAVIIKQTTQEGKENELRLTVEQTKTLVKYIRMKIET